MSVCSVAPQPLSLREEFVGAEGCGGVPTNSQNECGGLHGKCEVVDCGDRKVLGVVWVGETLSNGS